MDVSPLRLCFFSQNLPLTFRVHDGKAYIINTDVSRTVEDDIAEKSPEITPTIQIQSQDAYPTTDENINIVDHAVEDKPLMSDLPIVEEIPTIVEADALPGESSSQVNVPNLDNQVEADDHNLAIPEEPAISSSQRDGVTVDPDPDDGYTPSHPMIPSTIEMVDEINSNPFVEDAMVTTPCFTPPPAPIPSGAPEDIDNPTSGALIAAEILAEPVQMKVLVESVELFGHNVKKLVKLSIHPNTSALNQCTEAIRAFVGERISVARLLIVYYDYEVEEYVVLDDTSWSEFAAQKKHLLKLTVLPAELAELAQKELSSVSGEVSSKKFIQKVDSQDMSINADIDPDVAVDGASEVLSMPPPPPPPENPPPPIPLGIDEVDAKDIVLPEHLDAAIQAAKGRHNYRTFLGFNEEARSLLEYITIQSPPSITQTVESSSCPYKHEWAFCVGSLPVPVHRFEVMGVNGVRLHELDRDFQVALLRQKQRPIIIDLLPIIPSQDEQGPELSGTVSSGSQEQTLSHPRRITNEVFLAKYNSSTTSRLRKQVDKLLNDYIQCDWYTAKMKNTGYAHQTIVSLYKYIESEMIKLDLFNTKTKKGQELLGIDELQEEDFNDLKNHIEHFIFKRVSQHTKTLWPIYNPSTGVTTRLDPDIAYIDVHLNIQYKSPHYDLTEVEVELSPDHNINMKLAFMRFVALEHLGLANETHHALQPSHHTHVDQPPSSSSAMHSILSKMTFIQSLVHEEEWYLIMKACNRAVKFETPAEILSKFVMIMKMISHALDAYLHRRALHHCLCPCGRLHVFSKYCSPPETTDHHDGGGGMTAMTARCTSYKELEDYFLHHAESPMVRNYFGLKYVHVEEINYFHGKSLSADDLLPAMVYVLIQSNPSNIEYVLYICTEYRHPHLLKGEEGYVLAQLTSALEFVKNATCQSFDIPRAVYNHMLIRYKYTLSLLLECKNGHLNNVKYYVSKGADVNALSPDHKDNALTAAIRYNHYDILTYLLTLPMIEVNNFINLYRGQLERCTPLLLATDYNLPHVVVLLLNYQANRYLADYNQVSAFQIASTKKFDLVESILLADPMIYNVNDIILQGNKRVLLGLLLQNTSLEVTYGRYFHIFISCLHNYRIDLLKMIISILPRKELNINLSNDIGETALIVTVKQFLYLIHQYRQAMETSASTASTHLTLYKLHRLLQFAAVLLRYGADRYKSDEHSGQSPYALAQLLLLDPAVFVKLQASGAELTGDFCQLWCSPTIEYLNGLRGKNVDHIFQDMQQGSPAATSTASSAMRSSPLAGSSCSDVMICDRCNTEVLSKVYPVTKRDLPKQIEETIQDFHALLSYDPFLALPEVHQSVTKSAVAAIVKATEMNSSPHHHLPIYELAKERHHAIVKALLLQSVDVNSRCPRTGYTPLIAAVYNQDVRMVSLLLQAEALYYFSDAQHHDAYEDLMKYYHAFQRAPSVNEVLYHAYLHHQHHRSHLNVPTRVMESPFQPANHHKPALPSSTSHTPFQPSTAPMSPSHLFSPAFNPPPPPPPPSSSNGNSHSTTSTAHYALVLPTTEGYKVDLQAQTHTHMTALHYAAQGGSIEIVSLLLNHQADRGALNSKQHSPLDIALANDHVDVANMIKYDPSKVSISLAAKHGDITVLRALLHQGVSINTTKKHPLANPSNTAETGLLQHELHCPLIAAVAYNQNDCLSYILSLDKVQVNIQNALGYTALHYAVYNKNEAIILKLLHHGANRYIPDLTSQIAIHYANVGPAFRMYVNTTSNVNPHHVPAAETATIMNILSNDPARVFIHDVIRKNDFAGVVALLKQGVSVNLQRMDLHMTRLNGPATGAGGAGSGQTSSSSSSSSFFSSKKVKVAVPSIAESFIAGETPLIVAASYNRLEIAALLAKAPDLQLDLPDVGGWTALFHAAHHGHEDMVLLLLKAKANRRAVDHQGRSAVEIARVSNHHQIAALIEADPYCVHIHDMCEQGQLLHAIALLKQGCPPNYRDERMERNMQTPLIAAAGAGRCEIVRMLLRTPAALAGIDDQDAHGRTALMRAAAIGALDVTAVLLNAGCDRSIKDRQGLTAYDHAAKHSYGVMFKYSAQTMIR